jgi:hypothetical protein
VPLFASRYNCTPGSAAGRVWAAHDINNNRQSGSGVSIWRHMLRDDSANVIGRDRLNPAAEFAGLGDARDGDHVGRQPHMDLRLFAGGVNGVKGIGHAAIELLVDVFK